MSDETAPADSGILSIEQAVANIDKKEAAPGAETPEAEETQAAEAEPGAETTESEVATTTEEDGSEAEEPGDAENDAEAEEGQGNLALTAPQWWNKEQKALWETLDPKVQAAVYTQEENRERALQKSKQKLSDEAAFSAEANAKLSKRLQVLDAILPTAIQNHQGKWSNVDWVKAAEEMDPAAYQRTRAQYERESHEMGELLRQQQEAKTEQFVNFVREESEKLKSVAPDLVDEKQGPQRQVALRTFLTSLGTPPDRIARLSADEASIAYDAMRWRDAQTKAAAVPKKTAPPATPVIKPSASVTGRNPTSARITELQRKPRLSNDEAVELMTLKGN